MKKIIKITTKNLKIAIVKYTRLVAFIQDFQQRRPFLGVK